MKLHTLKALGVAAAACRAGFKLDDFATHGIQQQQFAILLQGQHLDQGGIGRAPAKPCRGANV